MYDEPIGGIRRGIDGGILGTHLLQVEKPRVTLITVVGAPRRNIVPTLRGDPSELAAPPPEVGHGKIIGKKYERRDHNVLGVWRVDLGDSGIDLRVVLALGRDRPRDGKSIASQ